MSQKIQRADIQRAMISLRNSSVKGTNEEKEGEKKKVVVLPYGLLSRIQTSKAEMSQNFL